MECESDVVVNSLDEHAQLAEVIERLTEMYPTLSEASIAEVVHELHARFNGARLREYVPLFVERNAHRALTELSVPYDDVVSAESRSAAPVG
jgi:hypothetical protein